jgi:hypothetical protein
MRVRRSPTRLNESLKPAVVAEHYSLVIVQRGVHPPAEDDGPLAGVRFAETHIRLRPTCG